VDVVPPADYLWDLRSPWPWRDNSIDEIFAHDVFEHVDNADFRGNRGKIWVLNEAWRVLRPCGLLNLAVPCVMLSDGRLNPGAFSDPTHVSFWTPDDRYYFCEPWNDARGERGRLGPGYGIIALYREIRWELRDYGSGREKRSKIYAQLEALK